MSFYTMADSPSRAVFRSIASQRQSRAVPRAPGRVITHDNPAPPIGQEVIAPAVLPRHRKNDTRASLRIFAG